MTAATLYAAYYRGTKAPPFKEIPEYRREIWGELANGAKELLQQCRTSASWAEVLYLEWNHGSCPLFADVSEFEREAWKRVAACLAKEMAQ